MLNKAPESRYENITIKKAYLPFLFIIVFVLINGFYNSLATELGFESWYRTFLFNPNDFMADLIKSALSFPGGDIPQYDRWNELYKSYFMDNPYSRVIDNTTNKISNLHGTPFLMLFFIIIRSLLSYIYISGVMVIAQCVWIVPFTLLILAYVKDNLMRSVVVVTCLLSYPVLFLMTRGHIPSGIVGVCLVIACILVYEEKLPLLMSLCLIIAINIRPNLLILCGLPFLAWDFYKAFGYAVFVFVGSVIIYAILFYYVNFIYPAYSMESFLSALGIYHSLYVLGDGGMAYGSSLLGAIKILQKIIGFDLNIGIAEKVIISSSIILGLYWILLVVSGSVKKFEALLAILSVSAVGTSVFGDYHLFSFLALIIIYAKNISSNYKNNNINNDFVLFMLCLLLIPKNYIFYHDLSYQIIINPMIMMILIVLFYYASTKNLYKKYKLSNSIFIR